MTPEEAKKLYMDSGGSGMAIDREEPEKYREFMKTASELGSCSVDGRVA